MTPIEEVRSLVLALRISVREAASKVVADMPREVLEADRVAALVRSVGGSMRNEAYLVTTTPEQLQLFDMARSLPRIIRFEIDGQEMFTGWQDATLDQVNQHYDWAWAKATRDLGIIERDRGHWARFEGPGDVAMGAQVYGEVPCAICGLLWRPGDPFERAHDTPVGDGTNDQAMRWAHRSCNRAESTGGTRHEAA